MLELLEDYNVTILLIHRTNKEINKLKNMFYGYAEKPAGYVKLLNMLNNNVCKWEKRNTACEKILLLVPEEDRHFLTMHYIDGVKIETIAEKEFFTERTVYNKMRTAKKHFKEKAAELYPDLK